jgi:hypothetical protein
MEGKEFGLYVMIFEWMAARQIGVVSAYLPAEPIRPGTPVPTTCVATRVIQSSGHTICDVDGAAANSGSDAPVVPHVA